MSSDRFPVRRTRLWLRRLLLAWVPCGIAFSCAPPEEGPSVRSALLITLDTTRDDALQPALTPHLEELAADGVRFERAYTTAPLTLPSHASMMSGLYPLRHGLRDNGARSLSSTARTLAERARERDFQTGAFLSSAVLDRAFGLDQGFDVYDSPRLNVMQAKTHYPERLGSEIVPLAIDWLRRRDPEKPFFLWVHIWDPHGPYEPPEAFRNVAPQHPYLGEVAAADHAVGRLLAFLEAEELYDETTLMVVADHGEAFWEHGEFSHGSFCWDTTMRVPMILRHPGDERRGTRVREVASVADVHPTLASAMGLGPSPGLDGYDLLQPLPAERGAYLESYYGYLAYGWSPLAGWVDAEGKYLHSSRPVFLPWGEEDSPSDARGATFERYRRAIEAVANQGALSGERLEQSSELRRELGELGYAETERESEVPHPLEPSEAPSPLDMVEEQKLTLEAQRLFNEGDYAGCERVHAQILARNPQNTHSWARMGICLIRQKRHLEAVPALERVYASDRVTASAAVNLGVCMRVAGRTDRAIECFEKALAIDGSHAQAVRHLMDLYGGKNDGAGVEAMRRRFEELTGQR